MSNPKKVLLIGSKGFLGSKILRKLRGEDFLVATENHDYSGKRQHLNIFYPATFKQILANEFIHTVICTAWVTTPGKFWTSPLNSEYRKATLRFAELSYELGVRHFIGFGTMSEYGESVGFCDANFTVANPGNIYGKEKLVTGQRLTELSSRYSRRSTWLRIFQAYGENEKAERFLPSLLNSIKQKTPIQIATPHDTLDWINVDDIADVVVDFAMPDTSPPIIDVGSGETLSVREVTELAYCVAGLKLKQEIFGNQDETNARRLHVSPTSYLPKSGWKARIKLEDFMYKQLSRVK